MTLTIKDEDETHDFSTYISDGERIINVTFPDASRRTKIDDTTWQVQLLPFQFMQWRATVVTTLTLEPRGGELRLSSTDLDIQGLPDELGVKGKVWLSMDGALKPARTANAAGRKVLGKLTVNLSAEVNEMVAMVPGFDDAVNLINDTVIANLQGSINATIAGDYAKWKAKQLSSVNACPPSSLARQPRGDETARGSIAPPPEPSVPPCTIVRQRSRVVVIVFQFETRRAETSARITGRTPRGALRGDAILCMLGTRARRGGRRRVWLSNTTSQQRVARRASASPSLVWRVRPRAWCATRRG